MANDRSVHPFAKRGFGLAAATYARARPSYPPDAVSWLAEALRLGPGSLVADVGAGTGKFTAALVATGASVTAVEPVAEMRDELRTTLPGIEVVDAAAEHLPFGDGSFDAITAAQAFHWFDTELAAAEFHRVLRPGGGIGLIWNIEDRSIGWVAELWAIVDEYAAAAPFRTDWQPRLEAGRWFGPITDGSFPHTQVFDRAGLVERLISMSFIASLDDEARGNAVDRMLAVVDRHPEASEGGHIGYPYVTRVYWAMRTD